MDLSFVRDHDTVVIACPEDPNVERSTLGLELKRQLEKEFPKVHFVTIGSTFETEIRVVFVYRRANYRD